MIRLIINNWRTRASVHVPTWIGKQFWKRTAWLSMGAVLLLSFWFCLPSPLFDLPFSTVLMDRDGMLLGAAISDDEQWRFPPVEAVPDKFIHTIVQSEDRRFFYHPGVDLPAVIRAAYQNLRSMKITSGASTISMQVIRMSRSGKPRTLLEKAIEMVMALRLELSRSKREILALYASYAPFGGNVVGIEAAAWRYFGRGPDQISWAETATLAVLPNAPALIYPGRNRELLHAKRNRLLERLWHVGILDSMACELAKHESLPEAPHPIPMQAPHLLARARSERASPKGGNAIRTNETRIHTTLQKELQIRATQTVQRHNRHLSANGIHNAAALILDVEKGQVLAYVGNVSAKDDHGSFVDIITAPRSTGSILKPLLFAGMMQDGDLLPGALVPDIPSSFGGFAPKNFARTYEGAVPASVALARSLNVPSVYMLQQYGVDRFSALLKKLGMTTLFRPADEYGLSLIIGGAEGTLWDITGIYAGMARCVNAYFQPDSARTVNIAFFPPRFERFGAIKVGRKNRPPLSGQTDVLHAPACWLTLQAMLEVTRPEEEGVWQRFLSSKKIAWKTGTSYGFRDAWAVGVTPKYAIGVWVGNADGEGRPDLIGISAAAPILFDLFGLVKYDGWFETPEADLNRVPVCAKSGYRAGIHCETTRMQYITKAGLHTAVCPYCTVVHCDPALTWRVNSDCESVANIRAKNWFVLPPAMEWYYQRRHSDYRPLPPHRDDCYALLQNDESASISLIYPRNNSQLYVPIELDGMRSRAVFEAAHRYPSSTIFWHLDDEYMGATRDIHQMAMAPVPGQHILTLVDENGERLERSFRVLAKE